MNDINPSSALTPIEVNLSPDAFHRWATHYYKCRQDFEAPHPFSPVPYFLLSRAIELEIKARHLKAKRQKEVKEKYGHDIVAAYRDLDTTDQILDPAEFTLLEVASKIYDTKGFEYFMPIDALTGYSRWPDLERLDAIARKLVGDTQMTDQKPRGIGRWHVGKLALFWVICAILTLAALFTAGFTYDTLEEQRRAQDAWSATDARISSDAGVSTDSLRQLLLRLQSDSVQQRIRRQQGSRADSLLEQVFRYDAVLENHAHQPPRLWAAYVLWPTALIGLILAAAPFIVTWAWFSARERY